MLYGYITLKQPTVLGNLLPFESRVGCLFLGWDQPETSQTNQRRFTPPFVPSSFQTTTTDVPKVSKLEGLTAAEEWFEKATMAGVKPNVPLGKTTGFDGFEVDGWTFRLGLGVGVEVFLFGVWKMGDVRWWKKKAPVWVIFCFGKGVNDILRSFFLII